MGEPDLPNQIHDLPASPAETSPLESRLFGGGPREPSNRGRVIGLTIAVAVLLLLGGALLLRGVRTGPAVAPNSVLPPDPYAGNLAFTQLVMSQSTSLSGGTSTFIDGHVKNTGPETVTGVTMQVLFRNDVGLAPQVETLPLTLIRTHEPYVDTEPVSAAPLKPGDDVEFRLIFETVNQNWNQQLPELIVTHTARR